MKDIKCKTIMIPVEMFEEAGLDDDMVIEIFADKGRIVIQQPDDDEAVDRFYHEEADCCDDCINCEYFCRNCGGCTLYDDCEDA